MEGGEVTTCRSRGHPEASRYIMKITTNNRKQKKNDFHDSRVDSHDFNDFHDSLLEFLFDFNDFHDLS